MREQFERLVERVEQLEKEVAFLKAQQGQFVQGAQKSTVRKRPVQQEVVAEAISQKERDVPAVRKQVQPTVERKPTAKPDFNLEKLLSSFLPKVFMFILLLGVLWGLKVATDLGYITNVVRVIAGYGGAAILYYFGHRLLKQENKVFSYTLFGGMIALGMLTTFAAHHLYGYFHFLTAFFIGLLFIGIGLLLSKKTKSEILTLFSAIAGFLLPFLLEGESVTVFGFSAYTLLLFISLFYLSLTGQHKYTFYFTFFLFHMTLLSYLLLTGHGGEQLEVVIVTTVIIQHFILLFIYFMRKIATHLFTEALIYTNFAFTLAWVKLLNASQEMWVYGSLAFFYVALTIYSFLRDEKAFKGVLSAVALFAVSAYILSFSSDEPNVALLLLLMNGAIGIYVGFRYKTVRTVVTGTFIYVFTAMVTMTFTIIPALVSLEHAVWAMLLLTLAIIYYTVYTFPPSSFKEGLKGVDMSLIIGQIVVLSYIIRLLDFSMNETAFYGETITHIYILVYIVAFLAMYFAHLWKRGRYVTHATIIGFFMLGLWTLPASLYSTIDRNFLFNVGVEIGYAALYLVIFICIMKDRFYIRSEKMKSHQSLFAFIIQTVYFLFLNKWYLSGAFFYDISYEYMLLIHTFLLFLFSFASVSIGSKWQWKPVKYSGALLILVCIFKLFFIDLVSISIYIRALLFIAVGIVGLLYSKTLFKEKN